MCLMDLLRFCYGTFRGGRWRGFMMLSAMGIGVAAVVMLTSLGEAARRYVTGEFASLGTNLVIVIPGKTETSGSGPAIAVGGTPKDLTIADAMATKRHRYVKQIAPVNIGAVTVSVGRRSREVILLGSTHELLDIRHWRMAQGRFLPKSDPQRAQPVCVIGSKIRDELFASQTALGQWLRIGDRRFRVIGVMATEGRSIGMDVEELVIIPVASAQALLNTPTLFRILVQATHRGGVAEVSDHIVATIKSRHQGEEDITVITQDAVLATFDKIFTALTLTVAGIAAISLAVAGVLIMNVMLISVSRRTAEIGLLKALGASKRQIVRMFLTEAMMLSSLGAGCGLLLGLLASWGTGRVYPGLPMGAPLWAMVSAIVVAVLAGLIFGALPAVKAAQLDPVIALGKR